MNEVMNFPSIESADDAQPEWWEEDSANATLTEVDVAGESITETYERALKVVTTASNAYGYQQYTYADQPRLKSGRQASVSVAVWCVGGATARIRLQASGGSLGASSSATAAAWTILTVEDKTLSGTNVQLRLEVESGTAYFVPLGLRIGTTAPTNEMAPRGTRFRWLDASVSVKTLSGLGDEAAWTDIDITANTSNLACIAHCQARMLQSTAGNDYLLHTRRNGASEAASVSNMVARVLGDLSELSVATFKQILDDQQIFEYYLDRNAGAATLDAGNIHLRSWEEWE